MAVAPHHRATFDGLARSLAERHPGHPFPTPTARTIVVVPSLSFPAVELRKILGIQYYEERMLFVLLLLDDPDRHLVYLTSAPVEEAIVEYYLGFLPDPQDARRRLHLISLGDVAARALSSKLLARPDVLEEVRDVVDELDDAVMIVFNVSRFEQVLAEELGIPVFGPHPGLVALGSKTGSRQVAMQAGVDVLEGAEDLWSLAEVERAVERLRRTAGGAVVVKLNNGFSGQGNAIVELDPGSPPGRAGWRTTFCAAEESWPSFAGKIAREGAVAEELVRGEGMTSPSVQMSISPAGDAQLLSTHDQVLGGPSDQVYLGCRFPARADYRLEIQQRAQAIGEVLVERGVVGAFGVDFFVVPTGSGRRVSMCEINLRVGGTTHPYWMARLAAGADYDAGTGELVAGGRPIAYTATDNLKSPRLVGVEPVEAIRAIADRGLAWRRGRSAGVMLHLLGALRGHGKMGMTCVASTPEEAERLDAEVRALLLR
ncbi:MAG TPA: peptide ligase PGM1-related protein [Actinomycetes bacterium]|nr:peptide ligase PGM1-related protein [Actinomycetes bacterium]